MKTLCVLILLSTLSFQLEAKSGVSLNEAVSQVKKDGKVLSAKTVNGQHEIKILTPNGTVKTINKKAAAQKINRTKARGNSEPEKQPKIASYTGFSQSRNQVQNNLDTKNNKQIQSNRQFRNSRDVMQLKQTKSRTSQQNQANNNNSRRQVRRTDRQRDVRPNSNKEDNK